MQDEPAIVEAASSLDQEALEAIFDEYAPVLYKYLLRRGLGPQEADQTVGDVFARLLEKLSEGKGPRTNLRAYLFQTAYHLLVDRARDRQRVAPLEGAEFVEEETKPVQVQAEESAMLHSLAEAMNHELTDEQRDVVILRFQEGFSLKETAEIVGKNVNAVKALQHRAMNRLRDAMSNGEGRDKDA